MKKRQKGEGRGGICRLFLRCRNIVIKKAAKNLGSYCFFSYFCKQIVTIIKYVITKKVIMARLRLTVGKITVATEKETGKFVVSASESAEYVDL